MSDFWEVSLAAADDTELAYFHAEEDLGYALWTGDVVALKLVNAFYREDGLAIRIHVHKNQSYFSCDPLIHGPVNVKTGTPGIGEIVLVRESHLVGKRVEFAEKRCSCGGWATYGRDAGIHANDISNTCDLLK